MVEILNTKLEVCWSSEDKLVLDAALALAARSQSPSYPQDVLHFLYQRTQALILLIAVRGEKPGEMDSVALLYKGQAVPEQISYKLAGTPCAQVQKHQICYYPTHTQRLFPEDAYLTDFNIESYLGGPLLNAAGETVGLIALMHQQTLPNPHLLELLLTILSPPLEALLEPPV